MKAFEWFVILFFVFYYHSIWTLCRMRVIRKICNRQICDGRKTIDGHNCTFLYIFSHNSSTAFDTSSFYLFSTEKSQILPFIVTVMCLFHFRSKIFSICVLMRSKRQTGINSLALTLHWNCSIQNKNNDTNI